MKAHTHIRASLLLLAAVVTFGCKRNVVKAAPPSVTPSLASQPLPAPEPSTTAATAQPEPPPVPEPQPETTVPSMNAVPAPPRPAPAEVAKPKPEPPQISPQLTPGQQADAERHTTDDVRTAEKNLQLAGGKQLNTTQNDLAEKVRGFLGQAHEAIRANDWMRAQTLASKAAILSNELLKSL